MIPGQTHLIGTVNVNGLPLQTHQSTSGQNIQSNLNSQDPQTFQQAKATVERLGYVPPGESAKTVVAGPVSTQPLTTNVGLVLEGAAGGSPNPCACSPPDPNNGVGPNHVFEMVNLAGIIYSKTGALVKPTFGLDGFFNQPASAMSDPTIMYDSISGRWFASVVNIPGHAVVFAVSTTNDPTGTFLLYSVSAGNNALDQPFIGTNDDKFIISTNDYNSRGTRFLGVQYWVLNKSQLVNGAATVNFVTITPDSTMFTLRPARHLTSSATFYMVTDCTGSCISSSTSTTTSATVVALSGVPPGVVSKTTSSFTITTSVIPPSASQPGGTTLATNDNRILSAVWESNTLWYSSNDACIPSGDTVTRSCVRLVQASTSGTPTSLQDFDYAAAGRDLFYPALSLSQGQLGVVYGTSSTTLFPSLLVTGRMPSDPPNTLQAPLTIRSGTASDTSTRYGDYFGAGTDPSPSASSTFWVSGEYRASSTFQDWNTAIAQVGAFGASFDFSVKVSPTSDSVAKGTSKTAAVTVSVASGISQPVALSSTVKPAATGLSVGFNPTSGNPNYTSTMTISTTTSTPVGTYTVTITGTSGTITHNATATYAVTDFMMSASPTTLATNVGASATSSINVAPVNGFTGTVTLAVKTNSTSLSCTLTSTSIAGGSGTSTLSCMGTVAGNYNANVTGTSGSLSHSVIVNAVVQDFKITANPSSITSTVGSAPTSTLTIASLGGFSGNVTLTAVVQCSNIPGSGGGGSRPMVMAPFPSCPTLSLKPSVVFVPAGGSVQSILTVNGSTTPAGNYMVTIIAIDDNLAHTVLVNVTFASFTVVSQPSSLTVDAGSNRRYTVGTGGFMVEMIGLVLPLLALIGAVGSRNTRTKNIFRDSFTVHQNARNAHCLVLVPNVGYVQVWKQSRRC
jgi:hypothetical protein